MFPCLGFPPEEFALPSRSNCLLTLASLFSLLMFSHSALSQDSQSAADDAELAMKGFLVPEGIEVDLWASEPLMANPVAFGIDEQGRIYVCETYRQGGLGVEDNRDHMNWLETDLSLQTVEGRLEMYKEFLGEGIGQFEKQEDRIVLVEDADGDGKADKSTIFADGFKDAIEGTGASVLALNGKVYYTCIPRLYLMEDTNGDGKADKIETLHDGYGVRVAFSGHDLHGLTLGPDGRLYFSIGDRGFNVETQEGTRLVMPDRGAVFRCEFDGSNLEVFASGMRNPQELAFDKFGNLFTCDNNSDSGDRARWVYIVEGGDSGWRMYYQYLRDRGPFNRERVWHPYRDDEQTTQIQPAYIVPPIANISDGPSGLVAYPGLGLADRYDDHFFLADFRGTPGNSGIRSFANQPSGASFELVDSHWFIQSVLSTDVDFGYDGRMFVSDWVNGWNGTGQGRMYTFSSPTHRDDPRIAKASERMKAGFRDLSDAELVDWLTFADQRLRLRAQYELARRDAAATLTSVATGDGDLIARVHAVWGLGQLLRAGKIDAAVPMELLKDPEVEIRVQAMRILGDSRVETAFDGLLDRLTSGTPREQHIAAIEIGKLQSAEAVPALVELLRQNANNDPVLRHAAVMGLTGSVAPEELSPYLSDPSEAVRLGVLLALRRHSSPLLGQFLQDTDPLIVLEAARAVHDLPIPDLMPALAGLPVRSSSPDPLLRRIMNANFRLGNAENAVVVAEMAANSRISDELRNEAIQQLQMWDEPPVLDRVTNEHRPVEERSAGQAREAVVAALPGMLNGGEQVQQEALKLAAAYKVIGLGESLKEIFRDTSASPGTRGEALSAIMSLETDGRADLLAEAVEDKEPRVRAMALRWLAETNPTVAVPLLKEAIQSGEPVEVQTAVRALGTMNREASDAALAEVLDWYLAGKVAPHAHLELLEAAEARKRRDAILSRLKQIEEARPADDPLADYQACLLGGNAELGREIFFGNAAASCLRCHKAEGTGGEVGPNLSGVGKEKERAYLLESIVQPNAKIAEGFESVVFALATGQVISGMIRGEDDDSYRLMLSTGETITVQKDDIDAQAKGQSGMPSDLTKFLSKREIRDLVEYLTTLKTLPAEIESGHGN